MIINQSKRSLKTFVSVLQLELVLVHIVCLELKTHVEIAACIPACVRGRVPDVPKTGGKKKEKKRKAEVIIVLLTAH